MWVRYQIKNAKNTIHICRPERITRLLLNLPGLQCGFSYFCSVLISLILSYLHFGAFKKSVVVPGEPGDAILGVREFSLGMVFSIQVSSIAVGKPPAAMAQLGTVTVPGILILILGGESLTIVIPPRTEFWICQTVSWRKHMWLLNVC